MIGMHRQIGRAVTDELAHIRQSIVVILTTLVGTRVQRRDFGSVLPLLVDQPLTDATLLRAYSATIIAVRTWEPRIRIERITRGVDAHHPGRAALALDAITRDGERISLQVSIGGLAASAAIDPDRLENILHGEYAMQRITEQDRVESLGGLL